MYVHQKLPTTGMPPSPTALSNGDARNPSTVLYKPTFSLYNLVYHTLLPQLDHLPPNDRSCLLRGHRFCTLADSIINNDPSPIIAKLGLSLPRCDRIEYLASLPEVIVNPQDEGDREALPGERRGLKLQRAEGLLALPIRKSRPRRSRSTIRSKT